MAIRRPRRAASACAHVRNAAPAGLRPRQMPQLACTSSARNSPGPTFVMAPRWRRSAELSSDGTKPRNALARAASPPKRAGVSSTAAKGQRDDRAHTGRGHQMLRDGIPRGVSFASGVRGPDRGRQLLDHRTQRRDDRGEPRRQRHLVEPRQDAPAIPAAGADRQPAPTPAAD